MTPKESIKAHLWQSGYHWFWRGPTLNGTPVFNGKGQRRVANYLWEKTKRARVPPGHKLVVTCGEAHCLQPAHQEARPYRERTKPLEPKAYNPCSRSLAEVAKIAKAYKTGRWSYAQIGVELGLTRQSVERIVRRYAEHLASAE